MNTALPHVGICTYGKKLGREIAASLSSHPFNVVELRDLASAVRENRNHPLDMVGLVLPENSKEEADRARVRFPKIPLLLVSRTGRELGRAAHNRNGAIKTDELKEKTALQEICWWVANELARPTELKDLSAAQIRPMWIELDGEGNIQADVTLRARWIFPGPAPMEGQKFTEVVEAEDREMFMREMRSLTPQSRFRLFPIRIAGGSHSATVVEAGLRRVDEKTCLLVLQPLAQDLMSSWERLATHDPLTKLFNRWGMSRFLDELQFSSEQPDRHFLVYVDLDRFKTINDVLGHGKADEVLVQVAGLVEKFFPPPCVTSRYMGDEFLIVTRGMTVQQAKARTEKLMAEVKAISINGFSPDFHLTLSAGISELLPGKQDVALVRVEDALRRAKEGGRGIMVVRRGTVLGPSEAQVMMEGLHRGQFRPWIQPIVGRDGKTVECYETVARFHEKNQAISPHRFLRIRGTQGLVSWMDRSIFFQVLKLMSERPDLKLSINFSAESFAMTSFPGCFLRLAQDVGVGMDRILMEISEECMKLPKDLVSDRILRMKQAGIQVLLDDFGSGLSPLSYLTDFPFSMVKLDGNITRHVEVDRAKFHFVKSIIDIAHSQGIKTVAEYVETQAQMDKLVEAGADLFQGYLFGLPAPPEQYLGGAGVKGLVA